MEQQGIKVALLQNQRCVPDTEVSVGSAGAISQSRTPRKALGGLSRVRQWRQWTAAIARSRLPEPAGGAVGHGVSLNLLTFRWQLARGGGLWERNDFRSLC